MPSYNLLFEVSPYKPGTGTVTLRMSGAYNGDDKGTQLGGFEWNNLIVTGPNYTFNYVSDQDGRLTESVTDLGGLSFRMGPFYDNEEWATYEWNNAPCRLWIGEVGQPFASYRKLYEATTTGLEVEGVTATVSLRALANRLAKPLLNQTYGGSGGAEGRTDMTGIPKPIAIGSCQCVDPVIVDAQKWIYQVHGYGAVQDITQVYDFAQPVSTLVASVSTYAELAALTLKPAEWAKCNALGMFRLGGASDKKISADVQGAIFDGAYPTDVADIVPALIRRAGISPAKVGTFTSIAGKPWSFYSKDAIDIDEVVNKAVLDAGGYLLTDNEGVFQVGNAFAPKTAKTLKADGSEGPTVGNVRFLQVADPIGQVFVGHSPCWNVHSLSDISPKLLELSTTVAGQTQAIVEAKGVADAAKSASEKNATDIVNVGKTADQAKEDAANALRDLDFNADTLLEQILRGDLIEQLVAARTMLGSKPINTVVVDNYKEFTDANSATVAKLNLIGAVSPDGQSIILNAEAVKSGDGEVLATTLKTLTVDSGLNSAAIDNLQEVLIDPTGSTARSVLKLDVNGYVTGTVATNNGRESSFTVITDDFKIVDPNGGVPTTVFGYENGKITIPEAEVGRLKVGAVDTESVGLFALQKSYTVEASANISAPYNNSTKQMLSLVATKDLPDSEVELEFFLRIRLGRYAGYFTVERTDASGTMTMDRIDYHAPEPSNLNNYFSFRMPFPYKRRFSGIPAGPSTWRVNLTHLSDNDSGDSGFLEAGTNIFVTEIKR